MSMKVAGNFRIMLLVTIGRGYNTEEDRGINKNYYLYSNIKYYTISPSAFFSNSKSLFTEIYEDGHIGGAFTYVGNCGVQFLELCY